MRNPRRYGATSTDGLTIVIKLGTSSIVSETSLQPQLALLSAIAEAVCALKTLGHRVVIVSSGAIGMGLKRMDLSKKPKALSEKQALAAIGQGRLIAMWDNLFSMLGQPIAQILLTRNDISDRSRYLNSTKTLAALLAYGVIPIVNENDTVSVSEIKFGDNDTLSAITAAMVEADYLFLLTDVDCLYTENPRRFPETARPVQVVRDIESVKEIVSTATLGSSLGTGGMETKLIAAELATGAGVATVITHGTKPSSILDIVNQPADLTDEQYIAKTPLHTIFLPKESPLSDRRWWVLHGLKPRGRIIIDEGAYRAIARSSSSSSAISTPTTASANANGKPLAQSSESIITNRSSTDSPSRMPPSSGNGGRLLPAGVIAVEGKFASGQAVTVVVQKRARHRRRLHSSQHHHHQNDKERKPLTTLSNSQTLDGTATSPEQSRPASPASRRRGSHHHGHDTDGEGHDDDEDEDDAVEEQIEFGRGLANYNSDAIDKIKGLKSSEIERVLGYIDSEHCVESITSLRRLEL